MNDPVSNKYDDIANLNTSSVNGVNSYKSNKILSRHIFHNKPDAKGIELHFDINSELPEDQQYQLRNLLESYSDCFAKSPMDLGSIDIADVPIPTISDDSISLPPYRLSLNERSELQRQVDELLQAGLIIPSNSSYASPAFLVNKAEGTKRLLKILGQIVNREGIKPNPSGLDGIRKYPIPKTIKQVRSFLGLSNFFRKFIPRFAELSIPLTNLIRGSYPKKKFTGKMVRGTPKDI
ncbi:hypothetical protein QTP88_011477 [Uroleucon formosanum]